LTIDPDKFKLISKSQFGQFKNCPRGFYYQYVKKIPQQMNRAMYVGIRFHAFSNQFFDLVKVKDGEMLFPRDKDFDSDPEINDMIGNFIDFERKFLETCSDTKYFYPLAREIRFDVKHARMKGIVDRIDLNEDGTLTLVEYKTGSYEGKKEIPSYLRQEHTFYKVLIESCGLPPGDISPRLKDFSVLPEITHMVVYSPKESIALAEPFKKRTITAFHKRFEEVLVQIDQNIKETIEGEISVDDIWPANGYLCNYCSYFGICKGAEQ